MNETILTQADEKILDGVLENFAELAKIPRPSKHEAQVGKFLQKFFVERGLEVVRDKFNNVIAEIPASPGKENFPLTILQAHMDMVCVARDGVDFNPLRDPIKLIRDEKFLSADGTSLGADDGIGVAEILYLVDNRDAFTHGKIRAIFTVDEEQGMSGANGADEKFFTDASYMINCDSENFGEIVVGCAGTVHVTFSREVHYVRPDTKLFTNIAITVGNLRGGHSGEEISCGRINALKVAVQILKQIGRHGKIRLSSIAGGKAFNAIPNQAEFVISTDVPAADVEKICADIEHSLQKIFAATDPNIKIETRIVPRPEKVLHVKDGEFLISLMTLIHSGVYVMSPENHAEVFASANLGIVCMNDDCVELKILARANADELIFELMDSFEQAGRLCQFETKFSPPTPAWQFNAKSKLLKLAEKVFTEQNGHAPEVKTIHVGLETSSFAKKNPALDIISIGTTNENIHTPNERLHLDTVAPHVKFIAGLLEKIAESN
ncbi:MAG: beta-Ala-His dipeptidase [Selenomonadaceae bacterium]|nr:beta-Ala-His dipeptidase [Selenomonadaceae bacterium]